MLEDSSSEPKKLENVRWRAPVKLIAASAVSILLGIGLCSAGGFNLEGSDAHPAVVVMGAIAFWGGVLGFVIGVLWWLMALVSD
jgi:hypothetical protein